MELDHKQLKLLRERAHFTQAELAAEISEDPSMYCRWESGKLAIPTRVQGPLRDALNRRVQTLDEDRSALKQWVFGMSAPAHASTAVAAT